MKTELLNLLRCPKTGQRLFLEREGSKQDSIESGWLVSEDGLNRYRIENSIPRFVPKSNYADNFGMQWNHFRQTQLDSHSGLPISFNRFWSATNWKPADLKNQWVLDVGCGAGRFAEIALNAGANLVALDYSSAVDACYENLMQHPNLHVVQGDIYALPFSSESFSHIYSLGVLQHTPDVAKAFLALPPKAYKGGRLCVDFYEKTWKTVFLSKYWIRPLTKRIPKDLLFSFLQLLIPVLLPISRFFGGIPVAGPALKRLIPVVNYYDVLPLTSKQQREWSLLDTFDWLAPQFDNPQTAATAYQLMKQAGLSDIEVLRVGHLVARGTKKT